MRKQILFAAIALFATMTEPPLAEHADRSLHRSSPIASIPVDELKQKIDVLGYDIRTLELDDGVLKSRIIDRESGLPVKAKFDPAMGELPRAAPGS